MKPRTALIVLGALALVLAAAAALLMSDQSAAEKPKNGSGNVRVFTVNLPDERSVLCVSEKRGHSGGISCDWSNAS